MNWLLSVCAGIVIAVVSGWLTWRWSNRCQLRVSVAARGAVASFQIEPCEEHILQVTITNTGNKLVNIRECIFTIDGEPKAIVVKRNGLRTMSEGLPRKLDTAEQCVIGYPAVHFQKKRLTGVTVEDHLGNRWHASSRDVLKAETDMSTAD